MDFRELVLVYQVRRWSVNAVKCLGTLDWECFHEVEPIIHWLLAVVNYNLFIEPPSSAGWCHNLYRTPPIPFVVSSELYNHYTMDVLVFISIVAVVKILHLCLLLSLTFPHHSLTHFYILSSHPFPGTAAWNNSEVVLLPGFLFSHSSLKDFWVGLCMLLTAMDSSCVCSRLLSSTSEHRHLVDAVINALSPNSMGEEVPSNLQEVDHDLSRSTVFWPALQTTVTLLDRLGSRFWQLTGKMPGEVCRTILRSPFYQFELHQWVVANGGESEFHNHQEEEEALSCSQVVYNWDAQKSRTVSNKEHHPGSKLHPTIFSWVLPFVESLLDYGEALEPVTINVINVLWDLVNLGLQKKPVLNLDSLLDASQLSQAQPFPMQPSMLSDLTDHALQYLAEVVELLFSNERYSFLLKEKSRWLPALTSAGILMGQQSRRSTKKLSLSRSPIAFTINPRSPLCGSTSHLPSSLLASSKTLHSILNSCVSQSLPQVDIVQFTCMLSPKLNLASSRPSSKKPPTRDSLQAAVTAVLSKCLSGQDIVGPFLTLSQSSLTGVRQVCKVKQEPGSEAKPQDMEKLVGQKEACPKQRRSSYMKGSGSDTSDVSTEGVYELVICYYEYT